MYNVYLVHIHVHVYLLLLPYLITIVIKYSEEKVTSYPGFCIAGIFWNSR